MPATGSFKTRRRRAAPRPAQRQPDVVQRDERVPTHDGFIWPVLRHSMANPRAIRTRMAEDVRDLLRSGGEDAIIAADDLQRLGWSADQVKCHGKAAIALALTDEREAA